jgi:hypothetical protein
MLLYSCRSGVLNQLRTLPLAACLSCDNDEDLITVISSEKNAIYTAGFHFPAGTFCTGSSRLMKFRFTIKPHTYDINTSIYRYPISPRHPTIEILQRSGSTFLRAYSVDVQLYVTIRPRAFTLSSPSSVLEICVYGYYLHVYCASIK